jgi:hypothetical protein
LNFELVTRRFEGVSGSVCRALAICISRKNCGKYIVSQIKKFLTAKQPENQWIVYRLKCVWIYIFRQSIYTM